MVQHYVNFPEWNGVTGFLMEPREDDAWTVCFPALSTEDPTKGIFRMPVRNLVPVDVGMIDKLSNSPDSPVGLGTWVAVEIPECDEAASGQYLAAWVENANQHSACVYFPHGGVNGEANFCFTIKRDYLRVVVPAGQRIVRKRKDFFAIKKANSFRLNFMAPCSAEAADDEDFATAVDSLNFIQTCVINS